MAVGKAAFAACAACHSVQPGGASGIGPNLHGVVGRAAGTAPGFAYSDAMKTSGITWSEAEAALKSNFSAGALDGLKVAASGLNGDIHGSAEYRAHLIGVMARRAVAAA